MALHDADLVSIQESRDLLKKARAAWSTYRRFSQAQVDRITQAMVEAGVAASESLARLAVSETGMEIGRAHV